MRAKKRLACIEAKLDVILKEQRLQAEILVQLHQAIDGRHSNMHRQKEAMQSYITSVKHMLESRGAPSEFVNSMDDLFNKGFGQ